MSTGKIVLGAVAGLAVGGILGILFAPDKGSVTRRQIMDKGNDYVDDLKSKCSEFTDSLADKFKNAKGYAKEVADNVKTKVEDAKNEVYSASNQNL